MPVYLAIITGAIVKGGIKMADILDFKDGWKRRIDKASKVLEDACENVKPDDAEAPKKLVFLAKMYKEVATDSANYANAEIENEKTEKTVKVEKWKVVAGLLGAVFAPVIGFAIELIKERKRNKRFYVASGFEDEDAYIKHSHQRAVDEALKE